MSQRPPALRPDAVLIGSVALEPNRWGAISPDRLPSARAAQWLARAEAAGFDGVELWENHAAMADASEADRFASSPLGVTVWNGYASFDDPDPAARNAAAGWVRRFGCEGVKFNVGSDRDATATYAKRVAEFAEALPAGTRLLCECHFGSAADDPRAARAILAEAGPTDRVQAIAHLGDETDHLDQMFRALGERIAHVHVNFIRQGFPPLREVPDLRDRVARLRGHGFRGSYTIEFVNGIGGEDDVPEKLVEAAIRDLAVLREAIASCG